MKSTVLTIGHKKGVEYQYVEMTEPSIPEKARIYVYDNKIDEALPTIKLDKCMKNVEEFKDFCVHDFAIKKSILDVPSKIT